MRDRHYLSVDAGTTSVKVALFDARGRMKGLATREYDLEAPGPDMLELDPETYWRCCREGIRQLVSGFDGQRGAIRSVSVCSQGETLIALDRHGRPVRKAIVWCDNRSRKEATAIRDSLGENPRTGQVELCPTWPLTKILWLRNNEPDAFRAVSRFFLVEDYLLYRLTGEARGEITLYSSSYMVDITRRQWWREALEFVGIQRGQLVELDEPGRLVGTVSAQAAAELGLAGGTRVITGLFDQAAAMVGAGNVRGGIVTETTGAALAVCQTLDRFPDVRGSMIPVHRHAEPDLFFQMGWCASGGMSLRWVRDTFFRPVPPGYDDVVKEAAGVREGSEGLMFFPFMGGPGTMRVDPDVRGVFYGLEMNHGLAHVVRAVLEGVGYALREIVEEMEQRGGPCERIISIGGGSRSRVWTRIKADITGRPFSTMQCPEAAALGLAVLQAVADGQYSGLGEAIEEMVHVESSVEPCVQSRDRYDALYRQFASQQEHRFGLK